VSGFSRIDRSVFQAMAPTPSVFSEGEKFLRANVARFELWNPPLTPPRRGTVSQRKFSPAPAPGGELCCGARPVPLPSQEGLGVGWFRGTGADASDAGTGMIGGWRLSIDDSSSARLLWPGLRPIC
jgi:hypothetical protein